MLKKTIIVFSFILATLTVSIFPRVVEAHTNAPVGTPDGTSLQSCDVRVHEDGRDPRNPIVGSLRHRIKQFNESTNDVLVSRCLFYISFLDPASFSIHSPLIITGGNHSYTRPGSMTACSSTNPGSCLYRGVQIMGGRDTDLTVYPFHELPVMIDATEFTQEASSRCAFEVNLSSDPATAVGTSGAWHQITNIRILAGRRDKAICDLSGRDISNSPAFRTATVIPTTPSGTPPTPTAPTCSFLPPTIREEVYKLRWEVGEGSDEVSLDAGSESIDLNRCDLTRHSCNVPRSTMDVTYTLMVQNRTTGSTGSCTLPIIGTPDTPRPPTPRLTCNISSMANTSGGYDVTWSVSGGTASTMVTYERRPAMGMMTSMTVMGAMGNSTETPTQGTTYLIRAVDAGGGGSSCTSSSLTLYPRSASAPAPTCTMTPNLRADGGTDLVWTSTNSSAVTINGTAVTTSPFSVPPVTMATLYTLIATGSGGSCQIDVPLSMSPPRIPTCTLVPTLPATGGYHLAWTSAYGTRVTLDGNVVMANHSQTVMPRTPTTYTFVVENAAGRCERSVVIDPNAGRGGPPVASPTCELTSVVTTNGTVTDFSWTSTGADSVTFMAGGNATPLSTALNNPATSPIHVTNPSVPTPYTLTARNRGGSCIKSVTLGGNAGRSVNCADFRNAPPATIPSGCITGDINPLLPDPYAEGGGGCSLVRRTSKNSPGKFNLFSSVRVLKSLDVIFAKITSRLHFNNR